MLAFEVEPGDVKKMSSWYLGVSDLEVACSVDEGKRVEINGWGRWEYPRHIIIKEFCLIPCSLKTVGILCLECVIRKGEITWSLNADST